MRRWIMHVDMDAFFASVEQLDNPSLRGKPVIVGGVSERGVVSTCSYEARKYGVHSAMPGFMARSKCPMGIFLPVRYGRYKEISNKIFDIFKETTAREKTNTRKKVRFSFCCHSNAHYTHELIIGYRR